MSAIRLLTTISLSLACFLGSSVSHAGEFDSDKVKSYLKTTIELDFVLYSLSKEVRPNTLFYIPGAQKAQYEVSVSAISKEFDENELKAEKKYKDAVFNVSGIVDSVSRAENGSVKIDLIGTEHNVPLAVAQLTNSGAQQAAAYDVGKQIKLQCEGASKPTMIYLYKCQEATEMPTDLKKAAGLVVNNFLAGNDISTLIAGQNGTSAPLQLFMQAFYASIYPADTKCSDINTFMDCSIFVETSDEKKSDAILDSAAYKDAFKKGKSFYHLD
ncbi:OB-fold protein [Bartonella sp. LJL80]